MIPHLCLAITWSIAIEEQFYLVWPQLFSRLGPSSFKLIFGSIILASIGFRVVHRNEPMVPSSVHTLSVMSDSSPWAGSWAYAGAVNGGALRCWVGSLGLRPIVLFYLVAIALLLFRDIGLRMLPRGSRACSSGCRAS